MRSISDDHSRGKRPGSSVLPSDAYSKRRRIVHRFAAAIGAGAIALFALWASGLEPLQWWTAWRMQVASSERIHQASSHARTPTSVAQPTPIGTDSSVSPTPRRLILASTRIGRNAQDGHASLGISPSSPQTYRVGSILANGTRIIAVYADHVELEREGRRASVYVEGAEPRGYVPPDPSFLTVGGSTPRPPAVASSRDSLTDVIRLTPVYEGQTVRGLEVYANARSQEFYKLGLEAGDRITAIDGQAINDPNAAIESLRRLTAGAALQVSIDRGGHLLQLSLDGAHLTSVSGRGIQ